MPGPRDASWSEIPQRNPTSIRKVELRNCFACNCCNCSCICFLCAWNLIASCLPVVDWQYRVRRRELEKLWQKFSFDKWCCCFRAKSSRHVLKFFESQTRRTKTAAICYLCSCFISFISFVSVVYALLPRTLRFSAWISWLHSHKICLRKDKFVPIPTVQGCFTTQPLQLGTQPDKSAAQIATLWINQPGSFATILALINWKIA